MGSVLAGHSDSVIGSLLAQNQINRITTSNVRPVAATMGNQLLVVATSVKKCVSKDGQASGIQRAFGHLAVFVDGFGEAFDSGVVPGEDGRRKERRGRKVLPKMQCNNWHWKKRPSGDFTGGMLHRAILKVELVLETPLVFVFVLSC